MNQDNLSKTQVKQLVQQAWWAGVNAVNGYDLVSSELDDNDYSSITHVLAVGKAASSMMLAVYDRLGAGFKGLLITKYGHLDERLNSINTIEIFQSSHPIPDNNSLIAGQKAVEFIESITEQDNLLMLVSGGASALAEQLPEPLTLDDLQQLNETMLSEQQTIAQINAARSNISLIKKGKLLNRCRSNSVITLVISDVEGDDVRVIGSGIGACDLSVATSKVLGSNKVARAAIASYLFNRNIEVVVNQESLYGDLNDIAKMLARTIEQGPGGGYIFGGEPVLDLPANPGRGGRNQQLALAIAKHVQSLTEIVVLAAGSDGTDGPTQAAGGLITEQTFTKLPNAQIELEQANAGAYLEKADALFISGPTGTNVMDLVIVVKVT